MVERRPPVGANLRTLRTAAELSTVELARRAGLSRATLTQLEAGAGNPTLETLYALANELGVALADLIAEPYPGTSPRVVRRGEGAETSGGAVDAHLLHRTRGRHGTLEIYALTVDRDTVQHSAAHPLGTREHLHVHTGRLEVGPLTGPVELDVGDYADFPADVDHLYRRLSVQAVEATLTIVTPRR